MWDFFLSNLEAAGAIGGYVSMAILLVSLITFAAQGTSKGPGFIGPKWAQPFIGALLGIIPGCGATIMASSMYKHNKLSFGGLFAAFIATLGEGSFVLLGVSAESEVAANVTAFAIVNAVGFTVGALLGCGVDALGFGVNREMIPETAEEEHREHSEVTNRFAHAFVERIGFFLLLVLAVFLAPGSIMALWGGGIPAIEGLTFWVATAFAVISVLYFATHKFLYKGGHDCSVRGTLRDTLLHSVFDITMVVTYVFAGLFIANVIIDILVGPEAFEAWMQSSAILVVLLAALIGATPGCGGMIAVAASFVVIPGFPIAALIAAGIATSGDGIFPLLAANKRDGAIVTASGLAAALIVGYLILMMGFEIKESPSQKSAHQTGADVTSQVAGMNSPSPH